MKKIFNFQFSIFKKVKGERFEVRSLGYTLIELTIVMVILLVAGGLVVGIITSALRGGTKTKIANDVAQNGNYALSVMSNMITNAQKFESFNSGTPVAASITACDNYFPAGSLTPTPGPFTGDSVTIRSFDGGLTTFACQNNTISSNSASLLDTSQVKTTSCQFICTQTSIYSPPRIDVSFTLTNLSGQTGESQGSADFSTTISFRNVNLK